MPGAAGKGTVTRGGCPHGVGQLLLVAVRPERPRVLPASRGHLAVTTWRRGLSRSCGNTHASTLQVVLRGEKGPGV